MDLNGRSGRHALFLWKVLLVLPQDPVFLPQWSHRTTCKRKRHAFYGFSIRNQKKHPIFGVILRANGFEKSKGKILYVMLLILTTGSGWHL